MESAQEGRKFEVDMTSAYVSILVVMESAQEAAFANHSTNMKKIVSILVVMESAQEGSGTGFESPQRAGFNPCCNGKCSGS